MSSFTDRKIFALQPFRKMLTIKFAKVANFLLGGTGGFALLKLYFWVFEI